MTPSRFEGRVSLGNILTIVTGAIMLAAAWGALQTDFRALAQRVDKGELRDDRTAESLEVIRAAIAEMRAEQRATRAEAERLVRQLDRIADRLEAIARGGHPPLTPALPKPAPDQH